MEEKFLHTVTKWRCWLGFQFLLIFIINIIGHVRQGNTLGEIFGSDLPFTLFGLFITILGFPSGIYFFFTSGDLEDIRLSSTWLNGRFIGIIWPAIYYPIFFFLIRHITKQKRNWKLIAIGLILFMILSFAGLSRIVEIEFALPH